MKTAKDIKAFIEREPAMLRLLYIAERLDFPDCWVAAGFIRNTVWDALHDRPCAPSANDVDVIYFDPSDIKPARDAHAEKVLDNLASEYAWSVKNQARMHGRNRDAPYHSSADAMAHWPETCTAIGARMHRGKVDILAPFGLDDLLNLRVRPSPRFRTKMHVYRARIAAKNWSARWPLLDIEEG